MDWGSLAAVKEGRGAGKIPPRGKEVADGRVAVDECQGWGVEGDMTPRVMVGREMVSIMMMVKAMVATDMVFMKLVVIGMSVTEMVVRMMEVIMARKEVE